MKPAVKFMMLGAVVIGTLTWLAVGGIVSAWFLYLVKPELPARIKSAFGVVYTVLENKYYLDDINAWLFAGGARRLGGGLWRIGDVTIIDGIMVNGTAKLIGWFSTVTRRLQSGFIYTYAFTMIGGVLILMTLWLTLARSL